jgi:hypothetical protein
MQCIQLDFWETEEESEIVALRKQIESIGASSVKVRKGTYARIGELTKIVNDLSCRLEHIERHICRGENG